MQLSPRLRYTSRCFGIVLAAMMLLSGCELLGLGSSSPLSDSTWELATFVENDEELLIPPQQTYEVSFADESVGAIADCNQCSGAYSTDDSEISITISCTEEACASPTLSLQFKNALLSAETYQREEGELTINYTLSGNNGGTLVFERAE